MTEPTDATYYLLFESDRCLYGTEATYVREIFLLPELTPLPAAPRDIVGVVNLRGTILPVMDINLRFGYKPCPYSIHDSVVVLEDRGFQVGIIVQRVWDMQTIAAADISDELSYGRDIAPHAHQFSSGVGTAGDRLVLLLNCDNLIHYSERLEPSWQEHSTPDLEALDEEEPLLDRRLFCPEATAREREVFQQRAAVLMQSMLAEEFAGLMPLAVVELNQEYFGLDLAIVREFADVRQVTPIPCCPPHVIGNMNLRGEIVTLFDIRSILHLPAVASATTGKALIVQVGEIIAGIHVDAVRDVTHLHPGSLAPIPAGVHSARDEYLRGTAPYDDRVMTILDLSKILTKGDLVVNRVL
ncbi:MAG: purine-binding chemotaxis protein CheW [Coleofasciculaceae cyanobacterium SM2_3_26]|nr:purine-binding chemotaxis protein CheW [Coleofasciculaceae cyanobacterium SM2_3_26]